MAYKLSFHSGAYYDRNLIELIKKLSHLGYDAIEINAEDYPWAQRPPHLRPDMDQTELVELSNLVREHGLDISAISAHIPLLSHDREERESAVKFTKDNISIAKQLNVDIVHGLSGKKPSGMEDDEAMTYLSHSVNEITSFAEMKGIKFAIEPVAGAFINNGDRYNRLKNLVSKGELYLNLDLSNTQVVGDNLNDFIKKFKRDIVHVHIKDGKGTEESFEFPPLGSGDVDVEESIRKLKDIGYTGYFSIEYVAHIFGYKQDINMVPEISQRFVLDKINSGEG